MSAITDFVLANAWWLWPIVSAFVTFAFSALAKSDSPAAKAAFDAFSALGIDAPKLLGALKALFAKKDPPSLEGGK
jgi:anaerobic C4-dicarboxylate transporter